MTDAAAIALARSAAESVVGPQAVGEFVDVQDEPDVLGQLSSFQFENLQPGYVGWFWSVSVSGGDRPSVNDVVALPGDLAIAAPAWTPYRDRIRPGDLSPGDVLPPEDDDLRLVPAWSEGDNQDTIDRYFAREVGLGRKRVLSLAGRQLAADRWYDGVTGPDTPMAEQAPGTCSSCGFLISLAGPLAQTFGVCANGVANADGRVVALTHGCGAHSAAKLTRSAAPTELPPHVIDTLTIDTIEIAPLEPIVEESVVEEPTVEEPTVAAVDVDQPIDEATPDQPEPDQAGD